MKRRTGSTAEILDRRTMLGAIAVSPLAISASACDLFSTDPAEDGSGDGRDDGGLANTEAPMLAGLVEAGELPALEERLPDSPLIVEPTDRLGVYGGTWNTMVLGPADTFWLNKTIGHESLLRWDPEWTTIVPNVAESIDVSDDGSEFTFTLRAGMRWSDGDPFTVDDIMFVYEDILLNEELTPVVPAWLMADDVPVEVERIDDHTVRFIFAQPRGLFLDELASDGGAYFFQPRHYLEQFHPNHNPEAEDIAREEGFEDWAELFFARSDNWENSVKPRLHPWVITTEVGESTRVVAERNPYYWKTDPEGRQLPYLDQVVFEVVSDEEVMLLKANNGEVNFHSRHINTLENKPVLAATQEEADYRLGDFLNGHMNQMILTVNLTHGDPVKREVFQNRGFRIGLSHALNREEMIDVVLLRQGEPWQAAPRPESPFVDEEMGKQYTEFDTALANDYLDRAGLAERDAEGFRLGPDGNRVSFTIDIPVGQWPAFVGLSELASAYWSDVGIDVDINAAERSLVDTRQQANEQDAWGMSGAGGLRDAILEPQWYLPVHGTRGYAVLWSNWYLGFEPQEEPPEPVRRQMSLYDEVLSTADEEQRNELFRDILRISKEEFYAMGIALPDGDYYIVKNNFHNVPEPMMSSSGRYPDPGPTNPEQFFIEE